MKISVFDGEEQVHYKELAGDISDYDVIISSSTPVEFPPKQIDEAPPEPPEVDPDTIETDTNRDIYKRIRDNPDSLPGKIRNVIYQWQVLTREQLDAWLESEDYAARSGGVRATLIVLENVTNEVNRIGEDGDEMRIVWSGEV